MAIKLLSVKCPACEAPLNVEEGQKQIFCSYCGTKVLIENENEHIYRNIDEAKIKAAETDRIVKLRQLEIEEKTNFSRKTQIILWLLAMVVLVFAGFCLCIFGKEEMGMLAFTFALLVGMIGGLILFENDDAKKKKRKTLVGSDEIMITDAMSFCREKNYNGVVMLFQSAGFTNVTAVPLNDLTIFNMKKNGQTEEVTINGESDFDEGDVFHESSKVLITYHCKK